VSGCVCVCVCVCVCEREREREREKRKPDWRCLDGKTGGYRYQPRMGRQQEEEEEEDDDDDDDEPKSIGKGGVKRSGCLARGISAIRP
jgi:hypothetical protein